MVRFMPVAEHVVAGRAAGTVRAHPSWLSLREPADARARSVELAAELGRHLPEGRAVIHDLGCGTGSMGRWLAPRLSGTQHWVLHDRDAELLDRAVADPPGGAADGASVSVETRRDDVTGLDPAALAGASLITASALLDMMTEHELAQLVWSCVEAGAPLLITLSVVGRVDLVPADPLDLSVAEAFNSHQTRTVGGLRLLGPTAFGVAEQMLTTFGLDVHSRPSPWQLGPADAALAVEWFTGWLGAACEQRPELSEETRGYAVRRRADAEAGRLAVTVHHRDLLALPRGARPGRGVG